MDKLTPKEQLEEIMGLFPCSNIIWFRQEVKKILTANTEPEDEAASGYGFAPEHNFVVVKENVRQVPLVVGAGAGGNTEPSRVPLREVNKQIAKQVLLEYCEENELFIYDVLDLGVYEWLDGGI